MVAYHVVTQINVKIGPDLKETFSHVIQKHGFDIILIWLVICMKMLQFLFLSYGQSWPPPECCTCTIFIPLSAQCL